MSTESMSDTDTEIEKVGNKSHKIYFYKNLLRAIFVNSVMIGQLF